MWPKIRKPKRSQSTGLGGFELFPPCRVESCCTGWCCRSIGWTWSMMLLMVSMVTMLVIGDVNDVGDDVNGDGNFNDDGITTNYFLRVGRGHNWSQDWNIITWSLCSFFCRCSHKQTPGGIDTQVLHCLDNPATRKIWRSSSWDHLWLGYKRRWQISSLSQELKLGGLTILNNDNDDNCNQNETNTKSSSSTIVAMSGGLMNTKTMIINGLTMTVQTDEYQVLLLDTTIGNQRPDIPCAVPSPPSSYISSWS